MGFSQTSISTVSNTMSSIFKDFFSKFMLKTPGSSFYIPYINPHYTSLGFVKNYDNQDQTSLSFGDTFSAWIGLDLWYWLLDKAAYTPYAVSYSINQSTARNADSYSLSESWSISTSSSFDLMYLLDFWIWQRGVDAIRASKLTYSFSFRRSNGYLQKSITDSFTPTFNWNYRWKADKSIGITFSYSYSVTQEDDYSDFYNTIQQDYGQDFRNLIEPQDVIPYPPQVSKTYNASTSYSFSTDLPDYWTPPIFFKSPIKLGFKINHTTSLSWMRQIYDYGTDSAGNEIQRPTNTIAQLTLSHNISFNISKNIDGGLNAKVVYQRTDALQTWGDDLEAIISWELGLNVTIRF